ncbi:cyclase family protein [Ameyamaea chiangmaiensis]|uniref:Cyclase family protein n=2 Tax=Ameyamaea chiangmaiensis TaxID=442969 RepID=A0A850P9E3_9PROT|nr:cyclase family protein [Ameyamaea chiangmaiensis]
MIRSLAVPTLLMALSACTQTPSTASDSGQGLWPVYDHALRDAKYIDLTHTITPGMPVWAGFGTPHFAPAVAARDGVEGLRAGQAFTYARQGFEATALSLPTDQLGTQLDPPAHWAPEYPGIDEIPATYALRPLVVIPMQQQVARDYGYQLQVADIVAFEASHGPIPAGSVVFVRSDWSRRWPDPSLTRETRFPGVSLAALRFLHEQRHILFHGHEPLDTDDTPTLEGEAWLMHHGYAQAEGVAHLDQVAATGCLVAIGFPKIRGGTGGLARYVAICPSRWPFGVSIDATHDAPLPLADRPLRWDAAVGTRVR